MNYPEILAGILPEVEEPVVGTQMEFTVDRAAFSGLLNEVASVINPKAQNPLLQNVHLKMENSTLTATGTNTALSAVRSLPLAGKHNGEAVFPIGRLLSLVGGAQGSLTVSVVGYKSGDLKAHFQSGPTKWTLPLKSPKGYPNFSAATEVHLSPVPALPFLNVLQQVRKAASDDSLRPFLNLIDFNAGRARASDASRFHQAKFKFPFDCQMPVPTAHDLVQRLRVLEDTDVVEVGETANALVFKVNNTFLISQKTLVQFPDVDEVLLVPTLANDLPLTVSRADLLAAVKRVRVTMDEGTRSVVLSLNHGSLSVEAKDGWGGFSVETVPATWNFPPRHLAFNFAHLVDLLNSVETDTCSFRLGKDLKTRPTPLLLEDAKSGFTAVLSQVKVHW